MSKIASNFKFNMIGNIVSRVMGLILTVYLARQFGPNDFGKINYANAIITYFALFASLGIQSFGIVQVAKNRKSVERNVNSIVSLRMILSIFVYLLLLVFITLFNRSVDEKWMVIITGTSILINSFSLDWVFNALQEMKYVSYSVMLTSMLTFTLITVPMFFNIYVEIYLVPIATSIAMLASNLYLITKYKRNLNYTLRFNADVPAYRYLISNSWPFFFSGVFATVNLNIDLLMIGLMRSSIEVGLYSSVYRIIGIFTLFISFVFVPLYPVFIEYYNEGKFPDLTIVINNVRKLLYILSIPLAVVAFTLNREVILTLYGLEYKNAEIPFTILILYVSVLCIREIYGYELTAWGLQKKYMNIVLISSSYNIIANIILIPRFGIIAASVNTLISELTNLYLMHRLSRRTLYIRYDNSYLKKIILSAFVMLIAILLLKPFTGNIFVFVAVVSPLYVTCLFAFKVITIKELKSLIGGRS